MRLAFGFLVVIAALLAGTVIGMNCFAPDAARVFMLIGVPLIVGLGGGWTAWHLFQVNSYSRSITTAMVTFGASIAALVWFLFLWGGGCEG